MSDELIALLPDGWTLNRPRGGEGYCWRKGKTIDVGQDVRPEDEIPLMLHEITHASVTCCKDSHCIHWWEKFQAACELRGVEPSGSDRVIADVRGFL